jgi:formamidopyrimidine-DNA glycosylase
MPELPEVENVARSLAPRLAGKSFVRYKAIFPGVLSIETGARSPNLPAGFRKISRHGKYLILEFAHNQQLVVHFRMTGTFYFRQASEARAAHTHVEFVLDSKEILAYRDSRRFGRLWWLNHSTGPLPSPLAKTGPDALAIEKEAFIERIASHERMMKPLLLNQAMLAGLGNIYVDEILFRSRIHPKTSSERLSKKRLAELWQSMREVLLEAIAKGGSSIRDFVDSEGGYGSFQDAHRVYGKQGTPCPACGAKIRRIVVAQRGTCFCPKCQRLTARG